MTAEPIARVVADLRAGRARNLLGNKGDQAFALGITVAQDKSAKVVDATAIYRRLVERDSPVWIYEDHPCIAPPFPRFDICYCNEYGNVIAMTAVAYDHYGQSDADPRMVGEQHDRLRAVTQPKEWTPAEPVEWDRVRWTVDTFCWVGGRGAGGAFPTGGPAHLWRFAVYDDGAPADLHWVQLLPDYPREHWDMAHLVLLGAMSFLSCRNVELVEPRRARPERRRIERTGVSVHELAVFPIGRSTKRRGDPGESAGVPLTSVRGNFATYGSEGRGLLFGKYAGRYWRPAHARGEREHGEHDTSYVLADDGPGGGG